MVEVLERKQVPTPNQPRYYRKVFFIKAEDSPNVRLAMAERAAGLRPSHREILPGVVTDKEYRKRRATWDEVRQCVGLDAQFYEGAECLMFPPLWLNAAEHSAVLLGQGLGRRAGNSIRAIGIDPAEGGDQTAMCCVDHYGVLELLSRKTPDTSMIVSEAVAFMRKWSVRSDMVVFDRGGGGKQHADLMRKMGHVGVRTVSFGEAVALDPKRGLNTIADRIDVREERSAYVNRRAQMYGELRELIDPGLLEGSGRDMVFAIPASLTVLRQEMAPIPLLHDPEGKIKLPPKNKRSENSTEKSLVEIIGHSPDATDSLVLAVHGLLHRVARSRAGSAFGTR